MSETVHVTDASSGLDAWIVLDDETLGPAAGGVRCLPYPTAGAALEDARRLARAMTVKCALAGLDAGGGKAVVAWREGMDRAAAFARLGEAVEALGGRFRTAGDAGTTAEDLAAMATTTAYVHQDESGLAAAVAQGLMRCLEACCKLGPDAEWPRVRVAVQGAGSIGAAVCRALAAAGADAFVADVVAGRARAVAAETGARVADPDTLLESDVDILAPCALGGVIDVRAARTTRAWAVCGAANNLLASAEAEQVLVRRGVLCVPDPVASAGAVIRGVARTVMGIEDPTPLIDRLGATARDILEESRASGRRPSLVARDRAAQRLARAGRTS